MLTKYSAPTAESSAVDHAGTTAAAEGERTAMELHHTLAQVLITLNGRRQGLSVESMSINMRVTRRSVNDRIRNLRAWGAVEPVPSPFSSVEQHWAITAHGVWMLRTRTACRASARPAHTEAPEVVPPRTYVNSAMQGHYVPPRWADPARGPAAAAAFGLPSKGIRA